MALKAEVQHHITAVMARHQIESNKNSKFTLIFKNMGRG